MPTQFTANCVSLYGNFSTCESTVRLDIQNTQDFFFYNNLVSRNIGGLYMRAGSSGTATAMRGLLHNNVFEENEKKPTLQVEGRQTTPYQQVRFNSFILRLWFFQRFLKDPTNIAFRYRVHRLLGYLYVWGIHCSQ